MIKNERQYRITRAQADRFSQTLDSLRKRRRKPARPREYIPLSPKLRKTR